MEDNEETAAGDDYGGQEEEDADEEDSNSKAAGVVVRLAARQFDADSSKPSSRSYTTRKVELASSKKAHITEEGVQGDYNHYRTVALKSTKDRAVSLLTSDVMAALRSHYPKYVIENGDLGENILVDDVSFDFFQIGKRYKFVITPADENEGSSSSSSSPSSSHKSVILEITEKMDPCANLCKLSYINDESLQPKQRIAGCQDFLQFLDRYDGYRGWYAKVIQEGTIQKGAKVVLLDED
jgi:MOSC domain-containing protein YiiM